MQPSQRVRGIAHSVTLALDARAKALAAGGRDVVNMSVGEPDSDAPRVVQEAARAAVVSGRVRYTPAAGTHALRQAVARHLSETRGAPFAAEQVVVCHSTKHALSGAVAATVDPGDEMLMPLPAWVSYEEMVRIAGATPVGVPPRDDLGPDFEALARAVTPRTRGVMINSPCNPSGYVWTPEEMERLAAFAVERDLWILSDEIYRRLVYEGPPNPSPVQFGEAARARTILLDGASKAYAMTGYRIGYAAGPREVTAGIERLHSQTTGCPNAISQEAFLAALQEEPPEVERMVEQFALRRTHLVTALEELGLDVPRPRGAFYVFPRVEAWLDERGSAGFCEDLLEEQGVALVPGAAFGADRHVRFSYALEMERIEEALTRLSTFLAARTATRA